MPETFLQLLFSLFFGTVYFAVYSAILLHRESAGKIASRFILPEVGEVMLILAAADKIDLGIILLLAAK